MTNNRKKTLVAEKRYDKSKPAAKPAKRKERKRKPQRPKRGGVLGFITGLFGFLFRLVWGFTWRIGMVVALVIGIAVAYTATTLPPYEAQLDGRAKGSVTLQDRNGDTFAWRGSQFAGVVNAQTVSPALKNAIVATEDKRFYRHIGVSPRGVASAIRINMREGRGPLSGHGGSTITQQTAKLLCLGTPFDPTAWKNEAAYEADCRRSSMSRKIKEAVYALAMEARYTKNEILTIYMNRAYFGGGAYGVQAAMQRYFGKDAINASVAESAILAGLLTAPSRFAPTSDLQRSRDRAATVLKMMHDQGRISTGERQLALDVPAELSEAAEAKAGGYFADWVMSTGPEFFTRNTTEDVILKTTLDQRMQKAAEDAMDYIFENKVRTGSKAQAAIVVMSADGAVRAMVGGRQTKVAGAFNRATQAKRQTGSTFKPFVYATALELGYSPNDTVEDEPLTIRIRGQEPWSPKNYNNKFHGRVTLTKALAESYNIPAVKVAQSAGLDLVRKVATDFGIDNTLVQGPSLALGSSESTLLEMTGAFAGILNGGSSVTPYGLNELTLLGDAEPLMGTGGGIGERVINQQAAGQLIYMMEKVISEGTGRRANLGGRAAAGKTGTTQAARDAWFIGFTADYVAGVWMGYDDNTPLKGVTGGGLPAEIWRETMVRVHENLPERPLPMIAPIAPTAPEPTPTPAPQPSNPEPRLQEPSNVTAEQILLDVLRSLSNDN